MDDAVRLSLLAAEAVILRRREQQYQTIIAVLIERAEALAGGITVLEGWLRETARENRALRYRLGWLPLEEVSENDTDEVCQDPITPKSHV